ncbi:unnamed protein product [Hydatigera taeniaeformis]|uniref:Mediator of RNA polymerase II transcription subunit 13 n=1 Tax=Hydatigena taeniaeformis TaxID=6205 RepID=A0A0R3WP99_HYDTA|nr:unnamed protein product [Hydatigera taeniaeformis]
MPTIRPSPLSLLHGDGSDLITSTMDDLFDCGAFDDKPQDSDVRDGKEKILSSLTLTNLEKVECMQVGKELPSNLRGYYSPPTSFIIPYSNSRSSATATTSSLSPQPLRRHLCDFASVILYVLTELLKVTSSARGCVNTNTLLPVAKTDSRPPRGGLLDEDHQWSLPGGQPFQHVKPTVLSNDMLLIHSVCGRHLLKEVTQRLVSVDSPNSGELSSQVFDSPKLLRPSNSLSSVRRESALGSPVLSRRPSSHLGQSPHHRSSKSALSALLDSWFADVIACPSVSHYNTICPFTTDQIVSLQPPSLLAGDEYHMQLGEGVAIINSSVRPFISLPLNLFLP